MPSGRNAAFTIYDEEIYNDLKLFCLKQKTNISQWLWSQVVRQVTEFRIEKSLTESNTQTSMASFTPITPPPRIIEDFTHVLRPYMNKYATLEELGQIRDSSYMMNIYAKFLLQGVHKKLFTDEQRKTIYLDYDRALGWLEVISSPGFKYTPGER